MLLLIEYYKKLDAKWAGEKKKVNGHFMSWCHVLKQAKKSSITSLLGKAVRGEILIQNSR